MVPHTDLTNCVNRCASYDRRNSKSRVAMVLGIGHLLVGSASENLSHLGIGPRRRETAVTY